MTHYETLGVAENATQEEIKRAYRKLAMQHHPDKGGDTNKFQEIQSAYDTIGNEQARQRYDMERRGGGQFRFNINGQDFNHGNMPPHMEDILKNFGFAFGHGFSDDPFQNFRQPRKNKDLQVEITIPLSSTLSDQSKTISVQTTNGNRYPVTVDIPKGVSSHNRIKYPNLGDNFFESLPRGDLYIKVNVHNDTNFRVEGLDLIKLVDIDCLNAIIGVKVTIEGLDGKKFEISIPSGTQHGTKFRIINQGLYAINENIRGNLIIFVNIIIPTNLQPEKIDIIKTLILNQ